MRRDTHLVLDTGGVVPRARVAGVEDGDRAADKLKEIFVTRHDDDFTSGRDGLAGEGADDVIRFESFGGQDWHPERLAGLVHPWHLLYQVGGHRRSIGLVVGRQLGTKRWPPEIEGRHDQVRRVVRDELAEHRHKSEYGICRLPVGTGQTADCVVGPIHLVATIDKKQTAS